MNKRRIVFLQMPELTTFFDGWDNTSSGGSRRTLSLRSQPIPTVTRYQTTGDSQFEQILAIVNQYVLPAAPVR
ncbi:MAG TPA: hypothetical protein VJN65_01075 [Bacteroidota bacterium]|nr:hypothetical protein [Bacteroidota bacterium]